MCLLGLLCGMCTHAYACTLMPCGNVTHLTQIRWLSAWLNAGRGWAEPHTCGSDNPMMPQRTSAAQKVAHVGSQHEQIDRHTVDVVNCFSILTDETYSSWKFFSYWLYFFIVFWLLSLLQASWFEQMVDLVKHNFFFNTPGFMCSSWTVVNWFWKWGWKCLDSQEFKRKVSKIIARSLMIIVQQRMNISVT